MDGAAFRPVGRLQKPAAKPFVDGVNGIAKGRDPRLCQQDLVIVDAHVPDAVAAGGRSREMRGGYHGNVQRQLNDDADAGCAQAQSGHRIDDALATDGGGFDGLAVLQNGKQ